MQIRREAVLGAGGIVLAALVLAGCGKQQANAAMGAGGPVPVGVVEIKSEPVAITTELSGRTSPYMVADVRPQVTGIVQKRLFTEGGDIRAGAVLYQIDPATYQASYDSAKAALAKSEATLLSARLKAERYKDLVAIKAVSQQDYDDANAAFKQAEAAVAADKATLEAASINVAYTRVSSPISGRIGRSSVTQGALVTANQTTALATVQQLDPIYVDVTQSSTALLRLKRQLADGRLKRAGADQAKVKLILEDGSAYPQEGKLAFSDVTVDASTGSVTLRAVFPNPKHDLLPGMYVRAVLEEGVREQGILVPQQAVSRDNAGNAIAMIVNAEGKVEARKLTTDRTVGDKWLVSSGLQAGDKVIVDGLQKIRPGAAVSPVPADAASAPAAGR